MSPAFTWKISDPNLLSKLKESKPLESIKSKPFKAFGLTFYFELYPNGSTQSDIGQIEIFISLASIPSNISTIILNTKLSLLELNQTISNKLIITKSQQTNSFYGPKLNEILNLNQLTFTFESELLNITLNNNTDVTKQWLQSPINVMNSNTNKPNENIIRPINNMIPMRIDFNTQSTNGIPLESEINTFKEHINQTMKNWADKVNQRFMRMEKEINCMKNVINANFKINKSEQAIISEKQQKLKLWFKDVVKLEQYYAVFVENGISDLFVVSLLTMDEIKEMNINKIGHRIKILYHIKILKEQLENINCNKRTRKGFDNCVISPAKRQRTN